MPPPPSLVPFRVPHHLFLFLLLLLLYPPSLGFFSSSSSLCHPLLLLLRHLLLSFFSFFILFSSPCSFHSLTFLCAPPILSPQASLFSSSSEQPVVLNRGQCGHWTEVKRPEMDRYGGHTGEPHEEEDMWRGAFHTRRHGNDLRHASSRACPEIYAVVQATGCHHTCAPTAGAKLVLSNTT